MCHDSVEVRASTLRTLRYLISSESEVLDFITINGHFLLARCLDIELDNKVSRESRTHISRSLFHQSFSKPCIISQQILEVSLLPTGLDKVTSGQLCILWVLYIRPKSIHKTSGQNQGPCRIARLWLIEINKCLEGDIINLSNEFLIVQYSFFVRRLFSYVYATF